MTNPFDQFEGPPSISVGNAFDQFDDAPNPYQAAAQQKFAKLKAAGVNPDYGAGEQFVNGRLLGALPTIMAGLETPFSMIENKTFNPATGYNYAKAQENLARDEAASAHPYMAGAMDLAGGAMTGAGAAKAGLTAVRDGAGFLGRVAGSAVDGAGLGAASGFLSNEGSDRLSGAAEGGLIGGAIGGGIPAAMGAVKAFAMPVISGAMARINPEDSARASLARALMNSGKTPQEIQYSIDNSVGAGQPQYTAADAMGKSGADMLSNVVRSPGEGGQMAADFLDARQASQGRDVANQLAAGLGVNQTAKQLAAALEKRRGADANVNYTAARNAPSAPAVDISPAIVLADQTLTPGVTKLVNPNSGIADNSVESAVRRAKSYLTDGKSQLTNFPDVLSAKIEIDNMIETGSPTVQRTLIPIKQALDDAMIKASPTYRTARDTFRQQSKAIEAIDTGKDAAIRGRPEDMLPVYRGMSPEEQAAYRTGYADPLLENATNGNPNANKTLPLSNEGTQSELSAMSQYQGPLQPGAKDQLAQALQRSSDMNATFRRARTGSQTFDNLAEGKQEGVDPGILVEAARGNFHGIALDLLRHASNAYSGATPEVRNYLAQLLLQRGPTADFASSLAPNMKRLAIQQQLFQALRGGALGASANVSNQNTSR